MSDDAPHRLTAVELRTAYASGSLSPVEAVQDVLERIDALNPVVNAFARVTRERAQAEALAAESIVATTSPDEWGALLGCPVTLKDLIDTAGIETTHGSYLFRGHIPTNDSAVARRARHAGSVLLGKTTTPEFGWKCPTDSPLHGATSNPWALERTCGGSSGGSAVAVACGLGPIGIGSDGGGSIRQPASFCGVVGFKPSFGRIPCHPPTGTIDTFNSIGILARSTADVKLALDVLAGDDEEDWYSLPQGSSRYQDLEGTIGGTRIAWSPKLGYAPIEPVVRQLTEQAAHQFEALGCTIEEADPGWGDPADWFEVLCMRMMAIGLRDQVEKHADVMDPALVAFVQARGLITGEELADAARERLAFQATSRQFFTEYDLLLTPTMSVLPFELGKVRPHTVANVPVRGMQWTPFTYPFNINGYPAASVPAGWTSDGLPVGLQIVGGWRRDDLVLRACAALENISDWKSRWPPVADSASPSSRSTR